MSLRKVSLAAINYRFDEYNRYKRKEELLAVDNSGNNILMRTTSDCVCRDTLAAAIKFDCLEELLSIKNHQGKSAYEMACLNEAPLVLFELLRVDKYLSIVSYEDILHAIIDVYDRTSDLNKTYFSTAMNDIIKDAHEPDKTEKKSAGDSTPLMRACVSGRTDYVRILANNRSNILAVTRDKFSVLMLLHLTETMADIILDAAKKLYCATELVGLHDENNFNAFEYACCNGNTKLLKAMMTVECYSSYINVAQLLHLARLKSLSLPDKNREYDEICLELNKVTLKPTLVFFDKSLMKSISVNESYEMLYGSQAPTVVSSREETLKSAISEYNALLVDAERCVKYLKFINDEFRRYYKVKHGSDFGVLNENSYERTIVNGLVYPVPKPGYTGLKKHSALQEFLLSLFKKYGLGQKAFKWCGFIPDAYANKMLEQGDFCVENRYSFLLFHNKLSHMLQIAILIYATENGEINTKIQGPAGDELSVQDILKGLIAHTQVKKASQRSIFVTTNDVRYKNIVTFNDPHCLSSSIMFQGNKLGLNALADYMIDSFCKGAIRLTDIVKQALSSQIPVDIDKLYKMMDDILLERISTPSYILQYSIHHEIQKGKQREDMEIKDDYAIIPKDYRPDERFKPGSFGR